MQLLFDNFEQLADAPNGVQKLRELILQLAVRGKLVEQDPNDEPANKLIKIIQSKKKNISPIIENEIPYELPKMWEWCQIGDVLNLINGRAFKPAEWSSVGLPIVRIKNLNDESAPYNYCDFEVDTKYKIDDGDFLISWSGTPGTSFGAFIWDRGLAVLNQHIFKCELMAEVYFIPFLKTAINSRLDEMITQAHGAVGLQHITKSKLEKLSIPLPPLNEQKRIAAKVNQLMALCDQLEKQKKQRDKKRINLNNAVLNKLLSSRESSAFQKHWQRIVDHFALLYDVPENVTELKKAILQLAVMGKLVPQNPDDEPASELLKRIQAEKKKLIRERKIKKEKPLPPIAEAEIPYELPKGWEWSRLVEIGQMNPRNEAKDDLDVSFIPMKLISERFGEKPSYEKRKWGEIKSGFTHFKDNDVVLAKITPCFENSKAGIMKGLLNKIGAGTTELHVFRGNPEMILPEYVYVYFKSPSFLMDGEQKMTGSAGQKRVPRNYVSLNPFPLPPVEEQKRIVAKVDGFLKLCDELEEKLKQSRQESELLMESVVQRIINLN